MSLNKELVTITALAERVGYGRAIQAIEAKWALHLKSVYPGMPWSTAMMGALMDIGGWDFSKPDEVERVLKQLAGVE